MEIFKSFRFEAAHYLPNAPEGHKCARLHGHSYRTEVWVVGEVDQRTGWVLDFAAITTAFSPLRDKLDHRFLNEIEGLQNPTSENLARWIFERLVRDLPQLDRVVVKETEDCGAVYRLRPPA